MNADKILNLLGWFSVGFGGAEMTTADSVSSELGLWGGGWLVRLFGLRELASGLTILAKPESPVGPIARLAGDAMDIGALLPAALRRSNPRRVSAIVATGVVASMTTLDVFCSAALLLAARRRARAARTASLRY